MKETPNNAGEDMLSTTTPSGIEQRISRAMLLTVVLAVVASLPFAQWRITAGLVLGGLLSLLNHRWLTNSIAAAFSVVAHGAKPSLKLAQYALRYFVITAAVAIAYQLDIVSLAATIAGLSSFVVALFAEALREFYFAIIHREEIS